MMRINRIYFICIIFLFIAITSCCAFSPRKKDDSDLLKDFLPLEWNDDYVFGSTQYPPRICVWNSKSGQLVQQYDFFKAKNLDSFFKNGGRWLRLQTMQVIDKNIWFITLGNQCSLIKLDIETGKIKYQDLKSSFEYLVYIPEANEGNGAVLVAPFAQYEQDVDIRLFDLNMNLLQNYILKPSDLHLLTIEGQYKDGCYYFCAGCHRDIKTSEPKDGTYKIVKLDLSSDSYEIIPLKTKQVLGDALPGTYMPTLRKDYYTTSFSVKPGKSDKGAFMVAVDFIGDDVGRFLFESYDLSSGVFSYSGHKIIYSEDNVDLFPRMYFQMNDKYSMIGNYSGDISYSVFYSDKKNKIVFLPNVTITYRDMKDNCVWCAKNSYKYLDTSKEWIYDGEGIYKVDLENEKVYLYSEDGSYKDITETNSR